MLLVPIIGCNILKIVSHRLNTKIEARNLEVKDLVKDLSDGVS